MRKQLSMCTDIRLASAGRLAITATGPSRWRAELIAPEWRVVVMRWWEDVLGQRILFLQEPDGRWRWEPEALEVAADPNIRFRSLQAARLACAALVYAFFVMEEVTSEVVPPSINPSAGPATVPTPTPSSPPQGRGGDN